MNELESMISRWEKRAELIRQRVGRRLQPADEPLVLNAAKLWDMEEALALEVAAAGSLVGPSGKVVDVYKEWFKVQKEARVVYSRLGLAFRSGETPKPLAGEPSLEVPESDDFEESLEGRVVNYFDNVTAGLVAGGKEESNGQE